ncbi:hypothetical protein BDV96DRAFT_641804 [Lophiotrema nucula]|uniref:Uncharacterized protein n=1 Tax=Lophiotrema nucula TaxID=690887 RepID=A0A6A5ZNX8_9PLEO|nr:hypothetical protein BDV96DRAFT_641804 [Lophiotrema nucula]
MFLSALRAFELLAFAFLLQTATVSALCSSTRSVECFRMANDHFMFSTFSSAPTVNEDVEENHHFSPQTPPAARFQVQNAAAIHPMSPELATDNTMRLTLQLGAAEQKIETLQETLSMQRQEMSQLKMLVASLTVNANASPPEIPRSMSLSFASSRGLRHMPSDVSNVPSLATTALSRQTSYGPPTPKTPKTPRGGTVPPVTPTNASSSRRRHVRTKTPEQRSLQKVMNGQKLYTFGMEPQDDRGLIADFFDEIHRWAVEWTVQYDELNDDIVTVMAELPVVKKLLFGNNFEEIRAIVADDTMRVEVVAAVVAKDIVYNTMCDHFLFNSGHPNAGACDHLFNQFLQLGPNDVVKKHEILVEQNTLYTTLHEHWGFRRWRDQVAEENSVALIDRLAPLVSDQATATGLEGVLAHYIKGYRIGFRMRMDAKKWVMFWPSAGEDFNPGTMVNESRTICGSLNDTNNKTVQFPQNFTVRFARSPCMTRIDFFLGREDKNIVHSALVQIKEKQCYIGAEAERKRSHPLLRNVNGNGAHA